MFEQLLDIFKRNKTRTADQIKAIQINESKRLWIHLLRKKEMFCFLFKRHNFLNRNLKFWAIFSIVYSHKALRILALLLQVRVPSARKATKCLIFAKGFPTEGGNLSHPVFKIYTCRRLTSRNYSRIVLSLREVISIGHLDVVIMTSYDTIP